MTNTYLRTTHNIHTWRSKATRPLANQAQVIVSTWNQVCAMLMTEHRTDRTSNMEHQPTYRTFSAVVNDNRGEFSTTIELRGQMGEAGATGRNRSLNTRKVKPQAFKAGANQPSHRPQNETCLCYTPCPETSARRRRTCPTHQYTGPYNSGQSGNMS